MPEPDDPAGCEARLPAENPDNCATVLANFETYLQKRDPQLMQEKFWPAQTFDTWVATVKQRASERSFLSIVTNYEL